MNSQNYYAKLKYVIILWVSNEPNKLIGNDVLFHFKAVFPALFQSR